MWQQILGEKPWYKSMTLIGLMLFSAATVGFDSACGAGMDMFSAETCASWQKYLQLIGGVVATLGLRKAAATKPTLDPTTTEAVKA